MLNSTCQSDSSARYSDVTVARAPGPRRASRPAGRRLSPRTVETPYSATRYTNNHWPISVTICHDQAHARSAASDKDRFPPLPERLRIDEESCCDPSTTGYSSSNAARWLTPPLLESCHLEMRGPGPCSNRRASLCKICRIMTIASPARAQPGQSHGRANAERPARLHESCRRSPALCWP
jgi:hypothetical protein